MNKHRLLKIGIFWFYIISQSANAKIHVLDSNIGDSYYYVDHYEVIINNSLIQVWPHLLEIGKWMPQMISKNFPSSKISEGLKINLYNDYYIEVVKVIPEKMILMSNLPSIDQNEQSQGIVMISVTEANGKTLVSIFMSRIYHWFQSSDNPQRAMRESQDFSKQRRETFKNNFLKKLKQSAEK